MKPTGQTGRPRHVPALLDSSSKRKIEQGSGLLIRGVRGSSPWRTLVLTWGFTASGYFLSARFAAVAARAHGSSDPGLVKNGLPGADAGVPLEY
jgi:hypothetical protein